MNFNYFNLYFNCYVLDFYLEQLKSCRSQHCIMPPSAHPPALSC